MSAQTITKIGEHINLWLSELEKLTDQQLSVKRNESTWSLSQLYSHLFRGTRNFHLMHVRKCLNYETPSTGSKTFKGRVTFLLGQFPPVRIKVPPTKEYTPIELTRSEIINQANGLLNDLDELKPVLASAVHSGKTQHPAFGYLNADEWLGIIAMHFQHHVRQCIELKLQAENTAEHFTVSTTV